MIISSRQTWEPLRPRGAGPAPALTIGGRCVTYADLERRIDRLTGAFAAAGVRPGDRIAYLGPTTQEALETFFASLALGACHVPLDPRMTPAITNAVAEDTQMIAVVVDPSYRAHIERLGRRQIVLTSGSIPATICEPIRYETFMATGRLGLVERTVTPTDPAVLVPAHPTGAAQTVFTHGEITSNVSDLGTRLDITAGERVMVATDAHTHPWSGWLAAACLSQGAELHICSRSSADALLDELIDRPVVVTALGREMLHAMTQTPRWVDGGWTGPRFILCPDLREDQTLADAWADHGTALVDVRLGAPDWVTPVPRGPHTSVATAC